MLRERCVAKAQRAMAKLLSSQTEVLVHVAISSWARFIDDIKRERVIVKLKEQGEANAQRVMMELFGSNDNFLKELVMSSWHALVVDFKKQANVDCSCMEAMKLQNFCLPNIKSIIHKLSTSHIGVLVQLVTLKWQEFIENIKKDREAEIYLMMAMRLRNMSEANASRVMARLLGLQTELLVQLAVTSWHHLLFYSQAERVMQPSCGNSMELIDGQEYEVKSDTKTDHTMATFQGESDAEFMGHVVFSIWHSMTTRRRFRKEVLTERLQRPQAMIESVVGRQLALWGNETRVALVLAFSAWQCCLQNSTTFMTSHTQRLGDLERNLYRNEMELPLRRSYNPSRTLDIATQKGTASAYGPLLHRREKPKRPDSLQNRFQKNVKSSCLLPRRSEG